MIEKAVRYKDLWLDEDGNEKLNSTPLMLASDLRPPTLQGQIARMLRYPVTAPEEEWDLDTTDFPDDPVNPNDNPPSANEIRTMEALKRVELSKAASKKAKDEAMQKASEPPQESSKGPPGPPPAPQEGEGGED